MIEKKSVEKEKRQVAERLLQEANEKLKKAIDAKDFVEIILAQSMIEALSRKMCEKDEAAREVELIQRQTKVILNFVIFCQKEQVEWNILYGCI